MRHRKALVVALVLAFSARASADDTETAPIIHLKSPSSVHTDGGSDLRLPPGYFLAEPMFRERDAEMRRLQDQETRLVAQNKSLRASSSSMPLGWVTLGTLVVTAFSVGYLLGK